MDTHTSKRFLAGPVAALVILAAAQLACGIEISGGITPPSIKISTAAPGELTPKAVDTPEAAVQTPQTEPTKGSSGGGESGGFACFGTVFNGVTCLTAAGWKTYTSKNANLIDDSIQDMNACPDGKIYAGTSNELAIFDGKQWASIGVNDKKYDGAQFVACGIDGSIWVGYYQGVAQYKDGVWKSYASTEYDTGEFSGLINGLEVAPDGTVWVATSSSVASFDGKAWTEYRQGKGFEDEISPEGLAVDSKSRVWAVDFNNAYRFENGAWRTYAMDESIYYSNTVTVDPLDRLWINTGDQGVVIFDGSKWDGLSFPGGEIHSNGVHMAAFDSTGRAWLALNYGIDVIQEKTVTHFRMDNADLAENEIKTVAVAGGGPALPAPLTKAPGSLIGSVTRGGKAVADADLEICVETLAVSYSGETPCSDQPFFKRAKTDAEGKFAFKDLPVGYYVLVIKMDDGWTMLGDLTSHRIFVEEGKATDLGELKLKTE
jgi:hypothetical protein